MSRPSLGAMRHRPSFGGSGEGGSSALERGKRERGKAERGSGTSLFKAGAKAHSGDDGAGAFRLGAVDLEGRSTSFSSSAGSLNGQLFTRLLTTFRPGHRGSAKSLPVAPRSRNSSNANATADAIATAAASFYGGGGDSWRQLSPAARAEGTPASVTTHFLLYLNRETFVGAKGEQLIRELRAARRQRDMVRVAVLERPLRARQTASEGLGLASALVRRGPSAQMPSRGRGIGASDHHPHRFRRV